MTKMLCQLLNDVFKAGANIEIQTETAIPYLDFVKHRRREVEN